MFVESLTLLLLLLQVSSPLTPQVDVHTCMYVRIYVCSQGAIKKSEQLTVCLLAVVVGCFMVDVVVSQPPLGAVVGGLRPKLTRDSIYTAVSLLGANVMPHNFYLHRCGGMGLHMGIGCALFCSMGHA